MARTRLPSRSSTAHEANRLRGEESGVSSGGEAVGGSVDAITPALTLVDGASARLSAEAMLVEFLSSVGSTGVLRHMFRFQLGPELWKDLKQGEMSPRELAGEMVALLSRAGYLKHELIDKLVALYPMRRGELAELRACFAAEFHEFRILPPLHEQELRLHQQLLAAERRLAELTSHGASEDLRRAAQQEVRDLKLRFRNGAEPETGEFLGEGRYRLAQQVGNGGLAEVWQAEDAETGQVVAVKILHGKHRRDASAIRCFYEGARILSRLSHKNLVRIVDTRWDGGRKEPLPDDGRYFYVMEYIRGEQFDKYCRDAPFPAILRLIIQVGEALAAVHHAGYVHRDVKASNILVAGDQAILVDFDLAIDPRTVQFTRAWGTTLHWAPEVEEGAADIDERADVYSLAVSLLGGLRRGALTSRVVHRAADGEGIPVKILAPVLRRALAEREERYPTMREFVDDLVAVAEDFETAERKELADAKGAAANAPFDALERYDRILAFNPVAVDALTERGLLALANDRLTDALRDFDAVERLLGPDTTALLRIAAALNEHGAYDDARRYLEWAVGIEGSAGPAAGWLELLEISGSVRRTARSRSPLKLLEEEPWRPGFGLAAAAEGLASTSRVKARRTLQQAILAQGLQPDLVEGMARLWAAEGAEDLSRAWTNLAPGETKEMKALRTRAERAEHSADNFKRELGEAQERLTALESANTRIEKGLESIRKIAQRSSADADIVGMQATLALQYVRLREIRSGTWAPPRAGVLHAGKADVWVLDWGKQRENVLARLSKLGALPVPRGMPCAVLRERPHELAVQEAAVLERAGAKVLVRPLEGTELTGAELVRHLAAVDPKTLKLDIGLSPLVEVRAIGEAAVMHLDRHQTLWTRLAGNTIIESGESDDFIWLRIEGERFERGPITASKLGAVLEQRRGEARKG